MSALVAYYSRAGQNYGNGGIIDLPKGNTEILAEAIAADLGAQLFKVETVDPYPTDYYATTDQAKRELREQARPAIQGPLPSMQTDGTDNHLMLADVTSYGLTGKQAEAAMFECGVTVNANALPYDKNGAWWTSGLRLGTPALTTLGMGESEMKEVASIIDQVLKGTKPGLTKEGKPAKGKIDLDVSVKEAASKRVQALLSKFVLYPELDLDFLKKEFVK